MYYLDIHTHSYYEDAGAKLLVNVFPQEKEKLHLPAYFSVGLHPWHIREETWEKELIRVADMANHPAVVAIGETGLDKTITIPASLQKAVFENHLHLAEKTRKPLILHCVRSYNEMLSYRKRSDISIPWIFHWFNANSQIATELARKNCYLSFGHMLFNEKSKAFLAFRETAIDNIFFETDDAGYDIRSIYKQASFLRNIPEKDLKVRIMDNFGRCFNT